MMAAKPLGASQRMPRKERGPTHPRKSLDFKGPFSTTLSSLRMGSKQKKTTTTKRVRQISRILQGFWGDFLILCFCLCLCVRAGFLSSSPQEMGRKTHINNFLTAPSPKTIPPRGLCLVFPRTYMHEIKVVPHPSDNPPPLEKGGDK